MKEVRQSWHYTKGNIKDKSNSQGAALRTHKGKVGRLEQGSRKHNQEKLDNQGASLGDIKEMLDSQGTKQRKQKRKVEQT